MTMAIELPHNGTVPGRRVARPVPPAASRPAPQTPPYRHTSQRTVLFGEALRPLRFALTGGLAGGTQLVLLALLVRHGWHDLAANAVAFLLAAQLNFVLSSAFTWPDRATRSGVTRRWLAFHGQIAAMAAVNMLVFMLAHGPLPTLVASALGIGVAAAGNFVMGDRLVFRSPVTLPVPPAVAATKPVPRRRKSLG